MIKGKTWSLLFSILSWMNFIQCQNVKSENTLAPFATGLNAPVCIANCGDSRLFVVDQTGYIRIVDENGNVNPVPFLDIHERVNYGGERGLLGLAFHLDYSANGYFYVNYVGEGDTTHIARFSVSESDPNLADPSSELRMINIAQPYTNHNGGDLQFGPDGYLYIGMGDGGSAGDPQNRAQNPMELFGKMLRIDVDNGNPYSIPVTNPFYGSLSARNEIWALGLRNPWRFSFDRLSGDLWIGDVGQNAVEEIDRQLSSSTGGENYGWRCYEGNNVYNAQGCGAASDYIFPVFTYPHGEECSITGGYVYRGNESSPFYGRYFYADYCSDRIWTLYNSNGNWISEEFGRFPGNNFCTFGEDSGGALYIAGLTSGNIYKIEDQSSGTASHTLDPWIRIIQLPSSGIIRLEITRTSDQPVQVSLYDMKGIRLFKDSFRSENYQISTRSLQDGIYLLKVSLNGSYVSQKLFIRQ
jgi:glucose/arabinose dehydrogenase